MRNESSRKSNLENKTEKCLFVDNDLFNNRKTNLYDCFRLSVNVWSRSKSGGRVHAFTGHSKVQWILTYITYILYFRDTFKKRQDVVKNNLYANSGLKPRV